jgi:hypothetical protein
VLSWKPEVQVGGDPKWCANGLAFATEDEAYKQARELMGRWMLVREIRAVESTEPVSHVWDDDKGLRSITSEEFHYPKQSVQL